MDDTLTHAVEDYLKIIYHLTAGGGWATTGRLAQELGVAPASVTGMLRRLASATPPLVVYRKHQGAMLTPDGERVALEVIRHHRLIELFLHRTLGYSWDEVHDEAEVLEHVISERMEARIAAMLGDPSHDPHGEPIPTPTLEMPPAADTPLSDLVGGQRAIVRRVRDEDPALLRHLHQYGLYPQATVIVIEHSPFDDTLRLQVEGRDEVFVLGPRVTEQVFVEVIV